MRRQQHLRLIERHPDSERFDALTTGTLQAIGGLATAFVIVGVFGLSSSMSPWLLAASLVPGIVTIGRWYLRRRRGGVLYLGELPVGWRPMIESMVANASEIAAIAEQTRPGAVRDHLNDSAEAALRVVRATEADARRSDRHSKPSEPHATDAVDLARLTESVRLLAATVEPPTDRRLAELAERTEQLRSALSETEQHELG